MLQPKLDKEISRIWCAARFLHGATGGGARTYFTLNNRQVQKDAKYNLAFCVERGLVERPPNGNAATRALSGAGREIVRLYASVEATPRLGCPPELALARALGTAEHPKLAELRGALPELPDLGPAPEALAPPPPLSSGPLPRGPAAPAAGDRVRVPNRTRFWPLPLYEVGSTLAFVSAITLGGARRVFRPREHFLDGGYNSADGGIDFRIRSARAYGFVKEASPPDGPGHAQCQITEYGFWLVEGRQRLAEERDRLMSHWSFALVDEFWGAPFLQEEHGSPERYLESRGLAAHEAGKVVRVHKENLVFFETGKEGRRMSVAVGYERGPLLNGRAEPKLPEGGRSPARGHHASPGRRRLLEGIEKKEGPFAGELVTVGMVRHWLRGEGVDYDDPERIRPVLESECEAVGTFYAGGGKTARVWATSEDAAGRWKRASRAEVEEYLLPADPIDSATNVRKILSAAFGERSGPFGGELASYSSISAWGEARGNGIRVDQACSFMGSRGARQLGRFRVPGGTRSIVWAIANHERWSSATEAEVESYLGVAAQETPPFSLEKSAGRLARPEGAPVAPVAPETGPRAASWKVSVSTGGPARISESVYYTKAEADRIQREIEATKFFLPD